jgi:UDP-3-O-[3-hydroxymyristoyl] N-acetylglucosamine deacetylase / 3-hydroxyacyl-[acyl-carrier-protein] dehydratase
MSNKQKTINKSIVLSGKGLHSGLNVNLTIKPAPENHGYKFQRVDLVEKPIINATVENVCDTSRGTTIKENNAKVSTVEHLLAAAYGLEIDNLLFELDGPEVPIVDGSAKPFVDALIDAQIVEQNENKKVFEIKNNICFNDSNSGVDLLIIPDEKFSISLYVDYNTNCFVSQYAELNNIEDFKTAFAHCRTFVFLHELEYLLENNLIKGGNLENAIVIADKLMPQDKVDHIASMFNMPSVKLEKPGIINNKELYFNNEQARHKLVDLLGDLALLGVTLRGKIIARRTGHLANIEFAKKIKQQIKKEKGNLAPVVNLNAPPVLDINQIKKLLPHRYPFLLVDKILYMDDNSIIGLKNVTANEEFFNGHFPDEPVMPGVLQIEAMAQVGGILIVKNIPDPENYTPLFMKIDNVKFKRKVVPGDTLIFKLELISPLRRGIASMRGQIFVGETLATEGELMAQVSRKQES